MITLNKSYSELMSLPSFNERREYLRLKGKVGEETFGSNRYFNQALYHNRRWKDARNKVIARDSMNCSYVCDLGCEDHPIKHSIYIHHINPITLDDIFEENPLVFSLENLIAVSFNTHQYIHYGTDWSVLEDCMCTIRTPNDTMPWR